jgi:hypothetical protein
MQQTLDRLKALVEAPSRARHGQHPLQGQSG